MSLRKNLQNMVEAPHKEEGMDIIIVSTTSKAQEEFWQERLMLGRGQVTQKNAVILVIEEDWKGGAGNGLGTLYGLRKAQEKGKALFDIDILEELKKGAAIALYHSAGKGTRLAPLPGSETNNKSAVKLPGLVTLDDTPVPITILEAVIRQTAIYAPSRKGRLSVFWGDQVFIPSLSADYEARHHVDLLARLAPMPDAEEWEKRGLHRYGLLAIGADGDASQVEKITHATAQDLIQRKAIEVDGGIGISLGSFSVSAAMTLALLDEFAPELDAKVGKLDSDPHFWMPMTLDLQTYLEMMAQKGIDAEEATALYGRIQDFLKRFLATQESQRILGCVDVGEDSYWWDYGQVRRYMEENLKLTQAGEESDAMRFFFGISKDTASEMTSSCDVDSNSVLLDSHVKSGRIRNSILVGVRADSIDVKDSIVIHSSAPSIEGKSLLLYNVGANESLKLEEGTLRADVYIPSDEVIPMLTTITNDGGQDWQVTLPNNTHSYQEIHDKNQNVNPQLAIAMAKIAVKG